MSKNANEGIVAQLNANYYPGYVRGLDSLFQLLETYDEQDGDDNSYMIRFLPINITDEPGFPYRGVMIDTSRQFYKQEVLENMIDSMMLGKINVFHWHIVDDDSWPLYVESYPDLTDSTAYSK